MTDEKSDDKSDKNESARPAEERNLEAAKDKTGTGSGVEQSAPEQSPENVPAPTGEVRSVGVRHGMFGTSGTGDTSGYGGLVSATVFPAPSQKPYGGWFDDVSDALEARLEATELTSAIESVSSAAITVRPEARIAGPAPRRAIAVASCLSS